jgi:cell division protein FtsB
MAKKRQAKGAKSQKIEASSSPTRELELLKSELAPLVCKYESLANKYDHDIKSFSYRTKVEEEANDVLEAQLAKLTSENMALQATHKELKCSHEKLVDSYASLEIAHDVVVSLVNFLQPLTPTCTCSLVNNEFACTKPCCSQASQSSIEHVFVESCDDLIAQENDELKQEVEKLKRDLYVLKEESQVQPPQDNCDDMVKKPKKSSTTTISTPQQHTKTNKSKIQEKGKGHSTSHCPTKLKAHETISKKRRRPTRRRLCYICKENGHSAADCPQASSADQGWSNCRPGQLDRVWPNGFQAKKCQKPHLLHLS